MIDRSGNTVTYAGIGRRLDKKSFKLRAALRIDGPVACHALYQQKPAHPVAAQHYVRHFPVSVDGDAELLEARFLEVSGLVAGVAGINHLRGRRKP